MVTRWSPDTCGCVLHFDTDSNGDPIFFAVEKVCEKHADIANNHKVRLDVKKDKEDKDNRKNKLSQLLQDNEQRNNQDIDKMPVDRDKLKAQVRKHTDEVTQQYAAIFSTDFALAEDVYKQVTKENKEKAA